MEKTLMTSGSVLFKSIFHRASGSALQLLNHKLTRVGCGFSGYDI